MSDSLWDDVLARVEGKVNRHSFATWFRPTTYLSLDGSTLRIGVPNAQFREWLSKNYLGVLQEALAEAGQPASPLTPYPFCTEISTVVEKPGNRSMQGAAVRAVR